MELNVSVSLSLLYPNSDLTSQQSIQRKPARQAQGCGPSNVCGLVVALCRLGANADCNMLVNMGVFIIETLHYSYLQSIVV